MLLGVVLVLCSGAAFAQYYLESESIDLAGSELVFDAAGNPYASGIVGSFNFPGIDSGVVTNAGRGRRYVAKIDLATRKPSWVAVVGASTRMSRGLGSAFNEDEARGIALHSNGSIYAVAYDGGTNFPLTGGSPQPGASKYVFRVSPEGQVTRHSVALDPAVRRVGAIALDATGNIYLTGSAGSGLATSANAPFPTSSVAAGCIAPYVMKLDATGQSTLYSTYLGYAGTNGERCGNTSTLGVFDPTGFALAVDAAGNAFVGGQAEPGVRATAGSPDYGSKTPTMYIPVVGAHASHAFVSKINATGSAIVFTARLGGSERERVTSLALDATGAVYLGGKTASRDFPSVPQSSFPVSLLSCPGFPNAPEMGFVTKLSADGKQIVYSMFLPVYGDTLANCGGGPGGPFAPLRIALDASNRVYATGAYNTERVYAAPANSIFTLNGIALLYVIAMEGQGGSYSTLYAGMQPDAAALDPFGNFWVLGGLLKRFSIGKLPVEFTNSSPLCAPSGTLDVRVAGGNNFGTVEFFVDGASAGSSPVVNGTASKALTLAAGVRRVRATYHGTSYFDGYSSEDTYLAVNQAGGCQ